MDANLLATASLRTAVAAHKHLAPEVTTSLDLSMSHLDLAKATLSAIPKLSSSKQPDTKNAQVYHRTIAPFLSMSTLVLEAARCFKIVKPKMPEALRGRFHEYFSKLVIELEGFCGDHISRVASAKPPTIADHFVRYKSSGPALRTVAEASFSGEEKEKSLSGNQLAANHDVSAGASSEWVNNLRGDGFLTERGRSGRDIPAVQNTLSPLGWKALAYFEIKELQLRLRALHISLDIKQKE